MTGIAAKAFEHGRYIHGMPFKAQALELSGLKAQLGPRCRRQI